ncbi:hypothetical protein MSG28_002238 [Choristoneura fumiferana]|uniref:Uncharacterized protein n=1 Tax=Choristoneura fumiferana TaxID=7141 RepID=A0ACC0JUR9_CHOFU|nr:hypothetical protein MSG28_002238 [Choristoneura fumiferana]
MASVLKQQGRRCAVTLQRPPEEEVDLWHSVRKCSSKFLDFACGMGLRVHSFLRILGAGGSSAGSGATHAEAARAPVPPRAPTGPRARENDAFAILTNSFAFPFKHFAQNRFESMKLCPFSIPGCDLFRWSGRYLKCHPVSGYVAFASRRLTTVSTGPGDAEACRCYKLHFTAIF